MEGPVSSYIALDLETTGLNPKTDKIIEIGACRVEEGMIVSQFSSLVNPRRKLEERITELTGITDDMVEKAPGIGEILGQAMEFFGELPLLGHQVLFDYRFLKKEAVNAGLPFERQGLDTLALCRKFMPGEEKKNLEAACRFYGVEKETAHRALSDARMAHFLYQEIKRKKFKENEEAFSLKPLIFKVKRDQPATKKQKEGLRELAKYHRICLSVDIDWLTRSEASRLTDQIILKHGRKPR